MIDVRLTPNAQHDFDKLLDFIARHSWGNPDARCAEINRAIERLSLIPEGWPVWQVRKGSAYRLMTVARRFFVPYIYYPSISRLHSGIISVRAIRHGAQRYPLRAVYERPRVQYAATPLPLSTTPIAHTKLPT